MTGIWISPPLCPTNFGEFEKYLRDGKWMMQTKPNSQPFFWLQPSHSTWVFRERYRGNSTSFLIDPWNFHVIQYPWKFHVSPNSCHLLGLDFFWNSPLLLVCIHIVLGSHLKQVTTILFSLSRAGSHIFKTAKIGR